MSAGDFAPLIEQLDRFAAAGRVATMWWRDDDAADASPALDRLLALGEAQGVPLALATVPAQASEALGRRLQTVGPGVSVLQHGYAHQNHADAGQKKIELGAQRPAQMVIGELATGRLRLETLFGARALPVLVPPWNRMAPFLVPVLPELGYRGLSQFGPRARAMPVSSLLQSNCHIDPIDWRGNRGFAGAAASIGAATAHLALRLAAPAGSAAAEEPTGLMTHHAAHDEPTWDFLERYLATTAAHPAARWLPATDVFKLASA
ncbi:MAG: polysaccharide deacetylase family protein [Reyranellaceae bacterium]